MTDAPIDIESLARQAEAVGAHLDAALVCCGGGGLISGTATALSSLSPGIAVYAVEPEGVATMTPSPENVVALVGHRCGSIASSSSIIRNGRPAVMTASFIANDW